MSVITNARDALAGHLGVVCQVYPYIPARPVPPCITINAAAPYVESDITFGSFQVNLSLELSVPTAANDTSQAKLDEYIEDILVVLLNNKYKVLGVSAPYALEANNTQYLSASITCSTVVSL